MDTAPPTLASIDRLGDHLVRLADEFSIQQLRVYGSVARGDARPDSDVNLAASFNEPCGLLAWGALLARLETLLARRVSLASVSASQLPRVAAAIVAEGMWVLHRRSDDDQLYRTPLVD